MVRAKLLKAAAYHMAGTDYEPQDLLSEAVQRALDGERKCPRGVAPHVFLGNAMKSIAWARREQLEGEPDMVSLEQAEDVVATPARSPERAIIARQDCDGMLAALDELFADDAEAQVVFMGRIDGLEADEIRAIGEWDLQAYATICRRMRNKINKKFPGGWRG